MVLFIPKDLLQGLQALLHCHGVIAGPQQPHDGLGRAT